MSEQAEQPIAYQEVQDTNWENAVGKFPWKKSSEFSGLVLHGDCPACKHSGAIDVFVATTFVDYVKGKASDKGPLQLVECRCTFKHEGAPDKPRAGCGRWGYVPVLAPEQ